MKRWLTLAATAGALLGSACLGTLERDEAAATLAFAPEAILPLPPRENRPYWLFRTQPGWCGAHEVRFGGDPDDPMVATVYAAIFETPARAGAAFALLSSEQLHRLFRDRMTWPPRPFPYPTELAGEQVHVTEYGVRLPPELAPYFEIAGQLTAVRAGRVTFIVDSIGVPPEQLVPAIAELVEAAGRLPSDQC